MKKTLITFLVMLFSVFAGQTYAHDPHHENDSVKMSETERKADSVMQLEMAEHQQMEAVNAFPNYHPLIVHFPIVLLIIATLFQLLSFFIFKKELSWVTLILLALGVITAWLSSNTFHADTGVLTGKAKEIFETHEQMADFTWWFSLIALIGKIISHFFLNRKIWLEIIVSLFLIASAITVSIAGHHGAMLVHMEGIGPMGKYLESYHLPLKSADTTGKQEEDHHVGELGKGPHSGTIEEADPFHMEIAAAGNDLIFYLLDGDAKPLDMKDVNGSVKMQYADKSKNTIDLMMIDGKLTAMKMRNGKSFTAICTLNKGSKSYSASFNSAKDLPSNK